MAEMFRRHIFQCISRSGNKRLCPSEQAQVVEGSHTVIRIQSRKLNGSYPELVQIVVSNQQGDGLFGEAASNDDELLDPGLVGCLQDREKIAVILDLEIARENSRFLERDHSCRVFRRERARKEACMKIRPFDIFFAENSPIILTDFETTVFAEHIERFTQNFRH